MIIKIMIIFEYNCQIQSSVMPPKKAMSYHKSLNDGLYPNQYTVNDLKALENLGTTAEFDASKIDQITPLYNLVLNSKPPTLNPKPENVDTRP